MNLAAPFRVTVTHYNARPHQSTEWTARRAFDELTVNRSGPCVTLVQDGKAVNERGAALLRLAKGKPN